MKLSPQQEKFAHLVAAGQSQSDAYRKAYPRSVKWSPPALWSQASNLRAKPKVSIRIEELTQKAMDKMAVTPEKVIRELARISFLDVRKLLDDRGQPKPIGDLDDDTAAAIAGLDVVTIGNATVGVGEVVKFKLADKKGALELLGRTLGIFEKDNRQRDSMVMFLEALNTRVLGVKAQAALPAPESETEGDDD